MPTLQELTNEWSRRTNDANRREDVARESLDGAFRRDTSGTAEGAQLWSDYETATVLARARREDASTAAHLARDDAYETARGQRDEALDANSAKYRRALSDADKAHVRAREDAQLTLREKVRSIEREHPVISEQIPLTRAAEAEYQTSLDKATLAHRRTDDDARDAMQRDNAGAQEKERKEESRANDVELRAIDSAGANFQRDDKNNKTRLMTTLAGLFAQLVRDYNQKRAELAQQFTAERDRIHEWFVIEKAKLG